MKKKAIFLLLFCFFSMLLCVQSVVLAQNPLPDIKANSSDTPITVLAEDTVSIAISLDAGNAVSETADWWLVELAPAGLNYLELPTASFTPGFATTYQGPVFDFGSTLILNLSSLTVGTHTYCFGIDTNMNGSLDVAQLYFDSVVVTIVGSNNNSVPNTPDNLQYSVVSSSQINLTWDDNSDNENGFKIEQSQDNVNYTMIDNVPENTTTYDVTGLSEGVDYYLRVCAYNDYGDSEYSNIIVSVISSILDVNYTGALHLSLSNTFPEFNASTQVAVEIDRYGGVTFGTGILSYEGDDNNGQARIKRSGTLTLAPYGNVFHANGDITIEVDENTSFNERLQYWYWNGTTWIQLVDENISGTWNGGLSFDLDEAVISGSTVGVTNEQGSIIWTLTLTNSLVD